MRKLVVLSVVGFAALVTSCNLFKGGEKKEEAAPTTEQTTTTDHAATAVAPTENALANAWQSACTPAEVLQLTNSRRTVALTTQNTFEKTENFFAAGCETPHALTYKVTGTYAMLGQNTTNPALQNVDFTVNTATITVNNAATVEMMNAQSFCGVTDWKVDTETDIAGKTCSGFTVQKGDVVMDVAEVKDNNVFFGQKFSFLSPDVKTRPEAVSPDAPYTKS